MKKHHETKDDEHPWLNGFEKKHGNEKIDILKKRIKELDNLVGTASVIIVCQLILFLGLIIGLVFSGAVSVSSDAASSMIGFVKSNFKK